MGRNHLVPQCRRGDKDFSVWSGGRLLAGVGDNRNGSIRKGDNVTTKSVKPHQRALAETLLVSEPQEGPVELERGIGVPYLIIPCEFSKGLGLREP